MNFDDPSTIDKEFRLCCGIFDFCPSVDGKGFIVANLGAFKVQSFRNKRKVDGNQCTSVCRKPDRIRPLR